MNYPTTESERKQLALQLCNQAKNVDLIAFIQDVTGDEGQGHGRSHSFHSCPACGESTKSSTKLSVKDNCWTCYACGEHGSVVDYAKHLYGYTSLIKAARAVLENSGTAFAATCFKRTMKNDNAEKERTDALHEVFVRIHRHGHSSVPKVVKYLEGRGISWQWQRDAFQKGILRMLPGTPREAMTFLKKYIGEELLRKAGLLKDGKRMSCLAFRPLVFLTPSLNWAEFRIAQDPEEGEKKAMHFGPKDTPFIWDDGRSENIAVVEGAIDLLSCAFFWPGKIIGLPGVGTWVNQFDKWFANCEGKKYFFYLDNDDAGVSNTKKLMEKLREHGAYAEDRRAVLGERDVNEHIQHYQNLARTKILSKSPVSYAE